ncbi:MAG: hypothetical protein ACRD1K_15305 [Acidimicrobiales bacterium]
MSLPPPARHRSARRVTVVTVTVGLVILAACGQGRTGGPRGEPAAVVRSAPDLTFGAGAASLEASAADAQSTARVTFASPPASLDVRGPGRSSDDYPELADPLALVDMVRGAVEVVSYGGVSVRGVSTFRYELLVNVERALVATPDQRRDRVTALAGRFASPTFYADVWVDGAGRVSRVQVPVDKSIGRPGNRDRTTPAVVTVDLFDYSPAEV